MGLFDYLKLRREGKIITEREKTKLQLDDTGIRTGVWDSIGHYKNNTDFYLLSKRPTLPFLTQRYNVVQSGKLKYERLQL